MKKISLFAATLLCSIFSFAYEFVNDKYCVYRIDVGTQTAEVVNFYSQSSSVTIPSSFVYQGDKYIVEGIRRYDFKNDYDSKYCYEDYEKNRACIVELNLPQTLKFISGDVYGLSWGAFSGMTRLKHITIPAGVEVFRANWFQDNSRLETIIFEGMPCYEYRIINKHGTNGENYTDCIAEATNPTAIIDSMKCALKDHFRHPCPKLQTIEVLPLKDYLLYKDKLNESYMSYSKRLNDSISVYKTKLSQHPYYYNDDNYFNKIVISEPILSATKAKENYAIQSSSLKKEYNRQLTLCRDEYLKLWNNMEQYCKQQSPEKYVDLYFAYNPEFSARIDTLLKDYKCEYTKQNLALAVLNNNQLGEKCQDKLWNQYSYLYKSKEDFLIDYNKSSNIRQYLRDREIISNTLRDQITKYLIVTKGFYDSGDPKRPFVTKDFRFNYDRMKKNGIPITPEIINQDPKAQKEFEKNGQYFDNPDEFFAAYITSNYKNILKEKQKTK